MPTLTIEKLTHIYPNGVKALDAVSLTIPAGLYGLLGPNGAGKSTLMRTVATLQAPTSGQVRFDDIDVLANPQALRRQLGYLPQDFGVYPRVSAYDMLDHMAILKGLAESKPRRADGGVDILGPRDRERGHLLAGGRVLVAPGLAGLGRVPLPVDQHEAVPEARLVPVRLDRCDHR